MCLVIAKLRWKWVYWFKPSCMRVLIVEDQPEMASALQRNLQGEYFVVDVAQDGERGLYMARTAPYDIILLDFMLPKMDGKQLCQALREGGKEMPILMMSVKTEVANKVQALDLGADDYLPKPFSHEELVARMRALLRRPKVLPTSLLTCDDLVMDSRRHTVTRGGLPINLTRKEFMLVECLLRAGGDAVSRATITEKVWDSSLDDFSNALETHILNIRKKIEGPGQSKLIHTIAGVGYAIRPPGK